MQKFLITALLVSVSASALGGDFDYQGDQRGGPSISDPFKPLNKRWSPQRVAEGSDYEPTRTFGMSDCVNMAGRRDFTYSVTNNENGFVVKCELRGPAAPPAPTPGK